VAAAESAFDDVHAPTTNGASWKSIGRGDLKSGLRTALESSVAASSPNPMIDGPGLAASPQLRTPGLGHAQVSGEDGIDPLAAHFQVINLLCDLDERIGWAVLAPISISERGI
jgi:hypothetical protein